MASSAPYENWIKQASAQYGIPTSMLREVLRQESGFNPQARSSAGALGIAQFIPSTAATYGVNVWDPKSSIFGAAHFLGDLYRKFNHNIAFTLAGYNAGAGAVEKYHGVPPYAQTQNYVKIITSRMQTSVPGSGSTALPASANYGGNSLVGATTSMRAPTPDELAREFGFSTAFFNTDPSLKRVINEAMAEGIDPSTQEGQLRFQAMIRNTPWYQKHSEAQRQWSALVSGDPTTANNRINTMVKDILFQAVQAGSNLDLKSARAIALDFLSNGIQDDQTLLKAAIGAHVQYIRGQPFKGQAGQYEEEYRKLTQDYGIPTTNDQIAFYVLNTSNQRGTEESVRRHVQQQAKQLYPGLAAAIDSGLTVRQAMDPYFSTVANTLEISPDQMTVKDPLIQQALQYRPPGADPKSAPGIMPIWEFQQRVKEDPRWMKTTNARDDMVGAGVQVLRDMGLAVPSGNYGQSSGGG